ncbi:hypothetical protein T492DRAFT_845481 [Pavlovales sp. CCMP2436]|nr:hypothetical protein T492DRAFT_845481 [Pavlovales sp. CCMP2436]
MPSLAMLFMLPLSACNLRPLSAARATMHRGVPAPHSHLGESRAAARMASGGKIKMDASVATRERTKKHAYDELYDQAYDELTDQLPAAQIQKKKMEHPPDTTNAVADAVIFGASLVLIFAASPRLIDSLVSAFAFPWIAFAANGAAPWLESSLGLSKPLSAETKALITTTTTILCLKLSRVFMNAT